MQATRAAPRNTERSRAWRWPCSNPELEEEGLAWLKRPEGLGGVRLPEVGVG